MNGADKGGEDDKGRQADWINDEGEGQDSASLPSPLGAYRSPLDEPTPEEAEVPAAPLNDPEGSRRVGDMPLSEILEEIRMEVQGEVDRIEDELRIHLSRKIDKSSVETMEQIAAHTAALNRVSDTSGSEARTKELKAFAQQSTEDIERRLALIAQQLERTAKASNQASSVLDSQIKYAEEVQKRVGWMQDQVIELQRADWRSMAIGAVVSLVLGFLLGYWAFDPASTWKEAILSSSDPQGLCEDMGFQALNQSPTENVCAIAYPRF